MRHFKKLQVQDLGLCEYCNGEGEYTVDYHDPSDFYGHGQYTQTCLCQIEDLEPKVNIIRIRPSGAMEVVGSQMDTILKGLVI